MTTEAELSERLSEVEDPIIGEDIVSLGLVRDIQIDGDTATMSLAINSPFAPAEMEIGEQIRETVAEEGLEADLHANVDNIRRGIGTDSRIGKRFLFAGIGYGGSCFPKDVQAIHHTAGQHGYDFKIVDAVMQVNNAQKVSIVRKMEEYFAGDDFSGKTFGLWGLSFKPETDDIREAPALYIAEELAKRGAKLLAYDPEAIGTFRQATSQAVLDNTTFVHDQKEALDGIDALVICTEWNEFRRPTVDNFAEEMKDPVIFDGRNLYDLDRAEQAGITYISVGRPSINVN